MSTFSSTSIAVAAPFVWVRSASIPSVGPSSAGNTLSSKPLLLISAAVVVVVMTSLFPLLVVRPDFEAALVSCCACSPVCCGSFADLFPSFVCTSASSISLIARIKHSAAPFVSTSRSLSESSARFCAAFSMSQPSSRNACTFGMSFFVKNFSRFLIFSGPWYPSACETAARTAARV